MDGTFDKQKASATVQWTSQDPGVRDQIKRMWQNWTALIVHVREFG
jgi:hypothetical protein